MSVSTSTDPVKTIIDILNDADPGEWTNSYGAPEWVERQEDTEFSTKTNRTHAPAAYVWSPSDGDFTQMGAKYDAYLDDQIAQVVVWDADSADRTSTIAGDVRDIIFDFATDNQSSTEWSEIAPDTESDLRAERHPRSSDHFVVRLNSILHAYREL